MILARKSGYEDFWLFKVKILKSLSKDFCEIKDIGFF